MRTIHKYTMPWADNFWINMPAGAHPRTVGVQDGKLTVWALVDTDAETAKHLFAIRGTGHEVSPEVEQGDFIGTIFEGKGENRAPGVWHVFSLGDTND